MPTEHQLPSVPQAQRSQRVEQLLAQIERLVHESLRQAEMIQQLRDEIAVLKDERPKPKFKASGMERATDAGSVNDAQAVENKAGDGQAKTEKCKRPGSAKRGKTKQLGNME